MPHLPHVLESLGTSRADSYSYGNLFPITPPYLTSHRSQLYSNSFILVSKTGNCTSSQYKCPDVDICIPKQDRCDGKNDCPKVNEFDGYGDEGWNCCTISNPCGEGKGDCDNDSECLGNLKCGQGNGFDDNCDTSLGFGSAYDCCYDPSTGPSP